MKTFKELFINESKKYYLLTFTRNYKSIGSLNIISSKSEKEIYNTYKDDYRDSKLEVTEIDSHEAKEYDDWQQES